jgi:hypothetical protein
MSGKRQRVEERQVTWHWVDPVQLLREEEERGDVVFEAPEASRIVTARPPRLPRVRLRRSRGNEIESVGLPFGARVQENRVTCWSCAQVLVESDALPAGPGVQVCPGCGARLPFV